MSNANATEDDVEALEALISSAEARSKANKPAVAAGRDRTNRGSWERYERTDNDRRRTSDHGRHARSNHENYHRRRREEDDSSFRKRFRDVTDDEGRDRDRGGSRWGNGNNNRNSTRQARRADDEKDRDQRRSRDRNNRDEFYRSSKQESNGDGYYRRNDEDGSENDTEEKPKEKANFGLSGALVEDEKTGNVYNGVTLKFREPVEARAPITRWRLYVFKKGSDNPEPIQVLHISKQSAFLFGRDERVSDVLVEHPSLSKQHCVLQYRAVPDKSAGDEIRCKPYLMDLGSTNGTFINGQRLEEARYYELRRKDVITLGMSTREYVLLTEHTT
jgi:smad nuclear-interacting protein 1